MTQGTEVHEIGHKNPEIAFKELFAYAHKKIGDEGILLIIDFDFTKKKDKIKISGNTIMYTLRYYNKLFTRLKCDCHDKTNLITLKYIFENEGRKCPLFHSETYSSGKDTIKNFMRLLDPKEKEMPDTSNPNEKKKQAKEKEERAKQIAKQIEKQDLIVTHNLARGYESEFVANLSDPKHISRSKGFAVLLNPYMDFGISDQKIIDAILSDKDHKCDEIMTNGPEIILDEGKCKKMKQD